MLASDVASDASTPPRILLVDDEPMVLRSLARALRVTGVDIVTADDAGAARALVEEQAFDAVLCDVSMPRESGLTFARFVRDRRPDLPIMLMTGAPEPETELEGFELGVLELLPKPLDVARLRSTVQRAIGLYRQRRARST
jgi:DNA-binding response OmpR family regulator